MISQTTMIGLQHTVLPSLSEEEVWAATIAVKKDRFDNTGRGLVNTDRLQVLQKVQNRVAVHPSLEPGNANDFTGTEKVAEIGEAFGREEAERISDRGPRLCHHCFNHWLLKGRVCPACKPAPDDLLVHCLCGRWRYLQSACTWCHVPLSLWPSHFSPQYEAWFALTPMQLRMPPGHSEWGRTHEHQHLDRPTTVVDAFITPLWAPMVVLDSTTAGTNANLVFIPIVFYIPPTDSCPLEHRGLQ